jgi:hypothetical protein
VNPSTVSGAPLLPMISQSDFGSHSAETRGPLQRTLPTPASLTPITQMILPSVTDVPSPGLKRTVSALAGAASAPAHARVDRATKDVRIRPF